jgi:hypothetical protein
MAAMRLAESAGDWDVVVSMLAFVVLRINKVLSMATAVWHLERACRTL